MMEFQLLEAITSMNKIMSLQLESIQENKFQVKLLSNSQSASSLILGISGPTGPIYFPDFAK